MNYIFKNPSNNSNGETIMNSTPILKKLLERADRWGDTHKNLVRSHPNFFNLERVEKRLNNTSIFSEANVKTYYCQPPCKNADEYVVSYNYT